MTPRPVGGQAEPISAQVDAYMGWLAEFDHGFVMLAAPEPLIAQGGHALDRAPHAGRPLLEGSVGESVARQQNHIDIAARNRGSPRYSSVVIRSTSKYIR